MKTYKVYDLETSAFTAPSEISAASPKQAAEKYLGGKAVRELGRSARIVVEAPEWPHKKYLYNKA